LAGVGPEAEHFLERALRQVPSDELLDLLERHASELTPRGARQALANPFLTREAVVRIAAQTRLLSHYEVRRALTESAQAPPDLAMRFLPGLYWRDLLAFSVNTRLHPRIRRQADIHLAERLGQLSVGEKISLARLASPTLICHLRHDPSPRVFTALLDNPRLTEGQLAPVAHSDRALAPILDLIANDRRWGVRLDLRVALARNPRTRLETALRLLTGLRKSDQRAVASDPRLPEPLRRRARLLLGQGPG
jgi:hypothetical protein